MSILVTRNFPPDISATGRAHLFVQVQRQGDGRWLIAGVGTGP